jgi:hypothetical protein
MQRGFDQRALLRRLELPESGILFVSPVDVR